MTFSWQNILNELYSFFLIDKKNVCYFNNKNKYTIIWKYKSKNIKKPYITLGTAKTVEIIKTYVYYLLFSHTHTKMPAVE